MPYSPSTDEGYVRLLVTDTNDADPIFTDAEIAAFITRNPASLKVAAAAALEAIARSEVLVSKKIRTQDLSTDGPAVAAELRASARALRDEAAADDADSASTFFVAPFSPNTGSVVPELSEHPWVWP